MSKYPPADATTQWFQNAFPGATMNLTADTTVFCIHTTEGGTWPTYGGGSMAPTYTAMPRIKLKHLDWRQHFPDEKSARALENHAGGVETNTLNCVQVELIGTCDPAHKVSWPGVGTAGVDYIFWPDAPDWLLQEVADFVAYLHHKHGLRYRTLQFNPYPSSINANRMTGAQWSRFVGICGHQHVPENVHGDPGDLAVVKIITMAKAITDPTPVGPVRVPKHKLEHPAPGHPEYEGDSHRAIDHAVAHDIEWVDLNALRDKDGIPVDTHYPYPLRHGFVDPLGLLRPDKSIFDMTRDEWSRLRSKVGNYRISALSDQIDYALRKGRKVEVDLKCLLSADACKELLHGDDVVFKTMASLNSTDPDIGTPGERLRKAKRGGGKTILICPRPLMAVPKHYRGVIDYFRRFKPRFV